MRRSLAITIALAGCTSSTGPITIDLADATTTIDVDGERELHIVGNGVVEGWLEGGTFGDVPAEQIAQGASAQWLVPQAVAGELVTTLRGDGEVHLRVWDRGALAPSPTRARSATWFDPSLLDDAGAISFARVMAAISDDGHGGLLLDRWFRAFAAGPGAGRAAFAQFLDEVATTQGSSDPHTWNLAALPFKVTGVHNRHDLARGADCGELRVSIASTHATLAPVHLLFIFHQPILDDDVTPDGYVHCRGTARRWAALAALDDATFATEARARIAAGITRPLFALAESVELTISPWQWRQWIPDGSGGLANPSLFQTIDITRINTPGATRDAFLAAVSANTDAITARTWLVPATFRATVAEVQPNAQAPLPDLSTLTVAPETARALAMIGCPRCHTDNADFIQTSTDRVPSPFYDRELDARVQRLDALAHGAWPPPAPFGPLQPL